MKYLFASLLMVISISSHAQQNHFIYIQADNRQPFYVKLDKKILSSSVSGYLIIPKLQDGSYDLAIGFPKNEWPEQKVTCSVNNNDAGYLLKNFGEKGWGLFNFQTMDLVMAEAKASTETSKTKENKEDAFATTLANVVNDPSIRIVEEPKTDTATAITPVKKPIAKKDKPTAKDKAKTIAANDNKDNIKKLLSKKNAEGLKMVYVDKVNGVADTINVVIPIEKTNAKTQPLQVDTTAVAVDKPSKPAKLIAANKKPAKKTPVAKTDIARSDKIKDSVFTPPVIVPEQPKVDVAQNNNTITIVDTTAAQPAKKLEDIIADIAQSEKIAAQARQDSVLAAEKKKADDDAALKAAIKKENEEAMLAADKKKADEEAALAAEKKKADEEAALAAEKKKAEEEATLAAEKKKAEEEATLAAEKKKAEEEATLAAEKKKAEEEATLAAEKKKAEEEATLAAEKKKAEEEATLAAEKKKAEEEATLAAEKKKAEEEATLAAEKKKAEEEATLAAEKKKAEEEATLAAEKKKAEEDAAIAAEKKKAEAAAALVAAEKKRAQDYADSVAKQASIAQKEIKKNETVVPVKTPDKPTTNTPAAPVTYACKYVADGDEFMSLRKKMSKGKSDNEMLFYAHQLFLKRCVTTKQVERLCLLFTNDMAKYNLFDDAYHYTVDPENFSSLQSQLTDDYYIKRFKVMLRQ